MRLAAFLIFASINLSFSQTAEEKKVINTIESFFEVFELRDSAKIAPFFAQQVSMVSTHNNKSDSTIITYDDYKLFLKAIGQKDGNKWREDIENFKVSIDESLAQVWCDYKFYFNDKYHHCGVDAFHLVKINGDWKITHLADTRKKSCDK